MAAHHDPESTHTPYSNLEVVSPESEYHRGQGIEVHHADHHAAHHHDDKKAQPVLIESDPTAAPFARAPSREEKIFNPYSNAPEVFVAEQQHPTPERQDVHLPPPPPTICGIRRRTFWIIAGIAAIVIIAAAVGGGVGASTNRTKQDPAGATNSAPPNSTSPTNTTRPVNRDVSIAALRWDDGASVSQFRLFFYETNNSTPNPILESAWSSDTRKWTVSAVTDPNIDTIKAATPLAASAGIPHTNTSFELVKNLYFFQPIGTLMERQSPYKEQAKVWGYDNFSGLYTASNASSLFSYWYQNFDTHLQILANFFQELGANSLSFARYVENNTIGEPWEITRQSLPISDGSSIAAAPAGSRRDLRLYLGGTDGTLKQYPYNLEKNTLGTVANTAFQLPPHTPLCVMTEDNRNWFSEATLPECARTNTGAFITHLILFASPDRRNLTLVSWNCSSGFLVQQDRINPLLKPNRTYLGLSSTSASNLTFVDQRVFVLFDEGAGPRAEEWQVPTSGAEVKTGQNGPWKLLGDVPIKLP
ncbi:hypothetical protein B0H67DRAFT_587080 [Lasiosphaeris hirsuta]|uniref:Fucose-specific lectin n=1 Tax=Lasiosphaeris hirsuta TaxID=260670 RepID=A0AA40AA87_9PEZI|nr:hypothetical protein B0H67DRAFT_587080 [Lasiosphaeris hirsuta]